MTDMERLWALAEEAASARRIYAATIVNLTSDRITSYSGKDVIRWQTEAEERWDEWHPLLAALVGGVTTGDQTP